jgi:GTP-binding protein
LLLHLVDVSSLPQQEPVVAYETVNRELASYNQDLATRPQFVVATKIDALDDPQRLESLRERAEKEGKPFFAISSATNEGVRELVNAMSAKLDELNAAGNRNDTLELAV